MVNSVKGDRPVIGVGVLVWRQKRLLLGQRMINGTDSCWQFPGGHLEADESVIECARREVLEETGLHASALRSLGYTNESFTVNQKNYLTLFVSCVCDVGTAEVMEPDKCSGWFWFGAGPLPQPLFEPISLLLHQQPDANKNISPVTQLYNLHSSVWEISPGNQCK